MWIAPSPATSVGNEVQIGSWAEGRAGRAGDAPAGETNRMSNHRVIQMELSEVDTLKFMLGLLAATRW